MDRLKLPSSFIKQDIKVQGITAQELEELYNLTNSYEVLFSRRARLFTQRNLKDVKLLDDDYRDLIMEHYTFLKRPVIVNNDAIFIGNSAKTIDAAEKSIHGNK